MAKDIIRMYLDLGYPCALCKLTDGVICYKSTEIDYEEFFCEDCISDKEDDCKKLFKDGFQYKTKRILL